MFKRVVSILKRLMGYQPTTQSLPMEATVSNSVKPSRVKSSQASKVAPTSRRPRRQSPAPTQRKQKTEAAPSTTAARKPGKKKPTARQVAMVNQSKQTGSKSKTAASKTRQHVK
jgi:hypothetical protein